MANKLLMTLVHMNIQAVLLIAVILFVRVLLRDLSKRYLRLLWMLAVLRLLCPFTLEISFGMMPAAGDVFVTNRESLKSGQALYLDEPDGPEPGLEPGGFRKGKTEGDVNPSLEVSTINLW